MSQAHNILKALKKSGTRGIPNYKLSRFALKYTSVISDLRKNGYNITAVRQTLRNGRPSGTWVYYLNDQDSPA
jgi:hypothetical protein